MALLIGIAVIGIGVALALGFAAFDANKDSVDVSQAANSFSQLDAEASAVALGDASVRDVDLGLRASEGQLRTDPSAGWIRVSIINATDGTTDWSVQETMGAVVYEQDGQTVAYQGGGVFRADRDGSTLVSRPEVHYRDGTLTIPIMALRGQGGVDSHVQVTKAGATERKFPDPDSGFENRITDGKVEVTVHSEYYEAWGAYFERSMNAYVYYDHDAQTATAVFLAIPRWGTLDDGIIATSGAGELKLLATGAYIDSYDSQEGPYRVSKSRNGTVKAVGDIWTKADSRILGDAYSGAVVRVEQNSLIDGDVFWTDGFSVQNTAAVTGQNQTIRGIPSITPIDGFVHASADSIRADNDNDATTVIESRELSIDGSSAELGAGSYDLENLHLEGKHLELNTTDGDIFIAVEDWVKIDRKSGTGGNLTVTGDGIVRIFVESRETTSIQVTGSGSMDVHLGVGKESNVHVIGQDSPQLRLYGPQSMKTAIAGSSSSNETFVGVIYAPAGRTGTGKVYIKHAGIYGQILTGNLSLGKSGEVHYDRALMGTPLPQSPTVARLEFMHVAVHPVNVTAASVRPVAVRPVALQPARPPTSVRSVPMAFARFTDATSSPAPPPDATGSLAPNPNPAGSPAPIPEAAGSLAPVARGNHVLSVA